MLDHFDRGPIDALTIAMRIVLEQPDATWPELVSRGGFSDTRAAALLVGEPRSLDTLAAQLNESRQL